MFRFTTTGDGKMNLLLGNEGGMDGMSTVFFTYLDESYCILQDDEADSFAIVSVIDNRIIEVGPKSQLVYAMLRLREGHGARQIAF